MKPERTFNDYNLSDVSPINHNDAELDLRGYFGHKLTAE
jgi:hypothetical protein